ncbi:MAG: PP2C family protein-serine/threonine phosphatase [Spirochaetota bacterium]
MKTKDLKQQYYIDQSYKTLTISRITSPAAAIIIALFLYQDIYILHFDFTLWYRLVSILLCSVYFILSVTILKQYIHYVIPLYTIILTSGIIMMLGIAYHIFINPLHPDIYIANVSTGIQTVFIVTFLISSGALRYMPILLIVPLSLFIFIVAIKTQLTTHEWTTLSNPIATAFFLSLLAFITEQRNFKDFILNNKLEANEEMLSRYKFTMEKELTFASQLHRFIMPQNSPTPKISLYYRPYYSLGGDFYDFIPLDKTKNRIGIFLSDVTGHGISSAFITALLKHYLIVGKKYYFKPDKLLYYLNEYLTDNIGANFVTALYCIIDFDKRELLYSNAAHYPPIIVNNDGTLCELSKIGKPFPIGILKKRDLIKKGRNYAVSTTKLKKGSKLVLYTDGIIELYNPTTKTNIDSNTLFNILKKHHKLTGNELIRKIEEFLNSHITSEFINDDICIIVMEV